MPDKYSFAPFDDSMSDIIRHLCPLGFRRRQIGLLDGNELTMLVLAWRVRTNRHFRDGRHSCGESIEPHQRSGA